MIVSRIDGGLGNQMFQYAYGAYLAKQLGCELRLDLSAFAAGRQHGYLLDRFRIEALEADEQLLRRRPVRYRYPSTPRGAWLGQVLGLFDRNKLRRYKESPFGFHPRHLRVRGQRYLVGYWQSESFFPGMRSALLQQFVLRKPLSESSCRIAAKMQATESLAIHIRRGDYLSNPEAAKIYHTLGLEYYMTAIQHWQSGLPQSSAERTVFVFSNDIPWCREHLQLPFPIHFVDHTTADTAHEDLVLMSQAKSCVIANSTFSWWGAWLNQHADCKIYAPARWFRPGVMNDNHLIPARWQRLEG